MRMTLARSLRIEGPTLTRHLDNMEQSGFVVRQPSATDRRAVRVEITEAGEAAHGRMLVAVIAFNRRLQAGLTRDDVSWLDEILTRLEDNLKTPIRPAAPRRT
jgi:DNA-binding MarR family transcriptional regulator